MNVGGIAQKEVLGRDPQGAIARDHLLLTQCLEGLNLLPNRLIAGANCSDLGLNRLLFESVGLQLLHQGSRISSSRAGGALILAVDLNHSRSNGNGIAHLKQQRLNLTGGPREHANAAAGI